MAALIALILWCAETGTAFEQPLLIEVLRLPVPAGVHHFAPAMGGGWYLSDQELDLVSLRSGDGSGRSESGGFGWSLSALDRPLGLATDGVRLYVADEGNHRIVEFDRELRPLSTFSTRDTNDVRSRFGLPRDVALSARGDLFVLDGESDEVVCFGANRRTLFRVGRDVPGGLPFVSPSCISVDENGNLLVGETGAIRRLDLFGNQLGTLALGSQARVRGVAGWGVWTAAVTADTLYLWNDAGPVFRWSRSALAPGESTGELRDVAWDRGTLTILSQGVLIGFRIET